MNIVLNKIELNGADLPSIEGLREKGRSLFERLQLPTSKTEQWKYTRLRDFNPNDFILSTTLEHHCSGKHCACHGENTLPFEAYEITFCNGCLQHDHFHLPDGVEALSLLEAAREHETAPYLNKSFDMASFPFAALNTAYLEQGLFLRIGKGTHLKKPIALVYRTDGKTKYAAHIRNVVIIENTAQAELIEYACHTGAPKDVYFNNIVNEFYIGKHASLTHYKLQAEAFKATHIALQSVIVKEDGRYNSVCLQTGADLARNETHVSLSGQRASATVNTAYMMNGWATIDTTTDIEHLTQNTSSNQLIKGVIGGQAKGVFQGKIRIAHDAVKSEGYQLHRALLLSDDAEVDVKPELEIYADDVKCSHGATSGDPDPEQLFYLRARGLDEAEAKQLLIQAFVGEVIDTVSDSAVRDWFTDLTLPRETF